MQNIGLILAIGLITACAETVRSPKSVSSTASSSPISNSPVAEQTALQTFEAPSVPVTAQYPNTMTVESGASDEGQAVHFAFKPQGNALDNAEIHVFLPSGVTTAAEQLPFVTGSNGLMENNGWKINSQAQNSPQFPYDWVKTVISFSTDAEQSGQVLLGQTQDQAIQVSLLYPTEMSDDYWSSAQIVLDSLAFKPAQP